MTLAELAEACSPRTTAQTIGRLETGMRNLSLQWMERIAIALEVDPETLVRSDNPDHPQIIATLDGDGPHPLIKPLDAILPSDLGGEGPLTVLNVNVATGPYLPGDQLWLRQILPDDISRAMNRDVLAPRSGGRFAFGRLIDRQGSMIGLLPPGMGQKQQVVDDPPWIAVCEMLVRRL